MTAQLALRFDDVPVTDKTQARYHAIAPCLAGKLSAIEQARLTNISYQKVTRWLRDFRHRGMPTLFPASEFSREPYTPERVIVTRLYFKCCAPRASDRELARAIGASTEHPLHHQTVKSLLERFFFWQHKEFHARIHYPVPSNRSWPIISDARKVSRAVRREETEGSAPLIYGRSWAIKSAVGRSADGSGRDCHLRFTFVRHLECMDASCRRSAIE